MDRLDYPISALKGLGPVTVKKFQALGIFSIRELLFHPPFRYEDYSKTTKISDLAADRHAVVSGKLELVQGKVSKYKRMGMTEAFLADASGEIKIVWFNMPFLAKQLFNGQHLGVYGKPVLGRTGLEFHNPQIKMVREGDDASIGFLPVYHTTATLNQGYLRRAAESALEFVSETADWLPEGIVSDHKLPDLFQALKYIHLPKNEAEAEIGRHRLKFEELFLLMLRSGQIKRYLNAAKAAAQDFKEEEVKKFVERLPYQLTKDQRVAAWAILKNLQDVRPMNRLLEGDVGSGKTIVAAMAILNTALNGSQAVLMAPTEILAKQHYQTLSELFNPYDFNIALLTGSVSLLNGKEVEKSELQKMIADEEIGIVIGTHALISEKVSYRNLGLVVVDEQHRFGVEQRKAIKAKTSGELMPHFLSMTATPIPRSLALVVYGDLDLSILKEMPAGRKKIVTQVVPDQKRKSAYASIAREVALGRQAFVICPLIDPSDASGAKSVTAEAENLRKKIFPNLKIGLLHGRLPAGEKAEVMARFRDKQFDLLVSTSVIEVGLDVPNASLMLIEGAERFGLAQLHQFRGRVGRSEHQSYCYLFASSDAPEGAGQRLAQLERSHDGFQLAEYDLQQRGPGEVYGLRQSGIPEMHFAAFTDHELIDETKKAAEDFLEWQSIDDYPLLRDKLDQLKMNDHLE